MTLTNLVVVLVRLYGLLLLFSCIESGQQAVVFYGIFDTTANTATDTTTVAWIRSTAIISVTSTILYAIVGLSLLGSAHWISHKVVPTTAQGVETMIVSTSDLALVTFSLAGIFFFVDGTRWFFRDGVLWYLSRERGEIMTLLDTQMIAAIISSTIKVFVGLLLVFGSKCLLAAIRWTREAGITQQIKNIDEDNPDKGTYTDRQ